ncbi:MAG: DMT family transporter [Polaromonas sp.]|jgi:S-adenosylmethionine uptake transporter
MQAIWMILSAFIFSIMAVCVKFAAQYFNNAELVFYRGVIGVVFMAAFARIRGTSLVTTVLPMHIWRSVVGVVALSAWFYAIAHLPLATAMTLNYMSSVWIAAFLVGGALMFAKKGERIPFQGALVTAILASFAGVVMLLRPTIAQNQAFAGLIGLLSGLGAAFAYIQVMVLARMGEPEARTVFYFAVGTTIAGALGMLLIGLSPWHWQHALWLLPIGLLASLGQLCMTKAYSMSTNHGGTLMAANLQYSGIIFSALFGLALFGDTIPPLGWAGMGLIVLSAIAATVLRARAAPDAPAEER